MICKSCGANVRSDDTICPSCNTPLSPKEGGNGFWDLLDKPSSLDDARMQQTSSMNHGSGKLARIVVACCVVATLGCLVAVVVTYQTLSQSLLDLQEEIRNERVAYEQETQKERTAHEKQIREITELREFVNTVQEEASVPPDYTILPRVRVEPLGFSNEEDTCLFECCTDGWATELVWEKHTVGYGWVPLDFDEESGVNMESGLRLEDDEDGTSRLIADGLTFESAGFYRCVAKDNSGNLVANSAILVVQNQAAADEEQ